MKKILKPTEWTQKAADKASQQYSEQYKSSCDIIWETIFCRSRHRLKRTDRAGSGCRRTGVAVKSRHTYLFSGSPINSALQKIWQMQVAQQSRRCLNVPAEASQYLWYTWKFLTQSPHTPDIIWLPCSARPLPHRAKLQSTALLLRQPKAKPLPLLFSDVSITSSFRICSQRTLILHHFSFIVSPAICCLQVFN